MLMEKRFTAILRELKGHAPFTLFGASTGLICMLLFKNLDHEVSRRIFYVFHPAHVLLSAIVTSAIFQLYSKKSRFIYVLLVGFFGSLGIGTLSDSLIPYIGELSLGMHIEAHTHEHTGEDEHTENGEHIEVGE